MTEGCEEQGGRRNGVWVDDVVDRLCCIGHRAMHEFPTVPKVRCPLRMVRVQDVHCGWLRRNWQRGARTCAVFPVHAT